MDKLLAWDKMIFRAINTGLSNPFFDAVMPFMRNPYFWGSVYVFLLALVLLNFKTKTALWWVATYAAMAALCDIVSSSILKKALYRLRPGNDPELEGKMNYLLGYKSMTSSFPSSHAFAHFAMAVFIFLTLRKFTGRGIYIVFLWAALICFAQVYVGVHYPLDVTASALMGALTGYGFATVFNRFVGLQMKG